MIFESMVVVFWFFEGYTVFLGYLGGGFRNPEKGAFAKGALCKFVANCAPNLRKIAGILFCMSKGGCATVSQICREFESQFRTILCKYPFSNVPSPNF